MDRVKKCENCRHFFYDNSTGVQIPAHLTTHSAKS